ncbi:MFS transporter [Streptomyces palmae]|uniref:MFS transporter n=1 Tax=Streptomyces palmae TaxID=1701085 RepID=UPI001432A4E7|nr:MFS transporter [Streptomyces palmae]
MSEQQTNADSAKESAPLAPPGAAEDLSPRRWLVLAVLCLVVTVVEVDATVVNVALPSMAVELSASSSDLAWVNDSYILTFAALMLIGGRLGDQFGHKRLLMGSLGLFGIASLLCTLASNTEQLVAWRALLGIGGAGILPASLALVTVSFPKSERPKAIGILSAMTVLGLPLGPVLGGWLLNHFWWGSVFLINLPMVAFALIATQLLIKAEAPEQGAGGLDLLGVALSTLGTGALLYAVIEGPHKGWGSPITLGAGILGVALLAAFAASQRQAKAPVLDLRLMRMRVFVVGSLATALSFFVFSGIMFVLTQYLQGVLGYRPLNAGLGLVPLAVLFTLSSVVAAPLAARIGSRAVIAIGLMLVGVGMLILLGADESSSYGIVAVSLSFTGFGAGLNVGQAIAASLSEIPAQLAGVASGASHWVRQSAGALGIAILGSVLASVYSDKVRSSLGGLPDKTVDQTADSIGAVEQVASSLGTEQAGKVVGAAHTAFVDGMHTAMITGAVLSFLSAAVVFTLLPKGNLAKGEREDAEPEAASDESPEARESVASGTS